MIDQKWEDDFGVKANYRIEGAEPSPNDISTPRVLPSGTILTLPAAVEYATDHNRIYQLEKENLYIEALDLRLTRHQFEPLLFGTGTAGYLKDDRGEDQTEEGVEEKVSFGISRLLETGATIGANIALSWQNILMGDYRDGLFSILSVGVTQPLLRGSDPNIVLEKLTRAERDLLYQVRSFNRFRKKFVVETITQYYLVLQTYDAAQNARSNYDTLIYVSGYAEKLSSAGRVPQFELDQAFQDKLIAWDTYIQAEKTYKQALDDFKLGLGMPTETEIQLDYNELTSLRGVEMKMPDFSETEAIETALAHRLDLANAFDVIKDDELKILVALDNMRAGLSVGAATSQDLKSPTEFKRETDIVADGSQLDLKRDKITDVVVAGFQLDLNLDKVEEENFYRLALIAYDQNQRAYEEKMDTVVLDVREAYRDLAEAAQRYKVQSEQLILAKQRFNNTMNLLQYARANTRDVLDAQRDLYRAQDAATEALVNYTVAMLRFYRDVEILQVRPDGMWQVAVTEGKKNSFKKE
jgi:outer membrane protein TolC